MATDAEKIKELQELIAWYEMPGDKNLFYALNRKSNEIAALLNKIKLDRLDLAAKDDKTFERVKILWGEAATVSAAVESLKKGSGILVDEKEENIKPTYKKPVTPESVADNVGELAGQSSG